MLSSSISFETSATSSFSSNLCFVQRYPMLFDENHGSLFSEENAWNLVKFWLILI